MSDLKNNTPSPIIMVGIFKILSLLVGLTSLYLGYSLFVKGIVGKAGSLDASMKDYSLSLKEAAPGIFFALFGAVIIVVALVKGFKASHVSKSTTNRGIRGDDDNLVDTEVKKVFVEEVVTAEAEEVEADEEA